MFKKQRLKLRMLHVEYDFNDDKNPISTFYGNTSYKFEDVRLEWIEIYHVFEIGDLEHGEENILEDYQCLQQSTLHQISTKPTTFPFYDMVCWIISHTDVSTCNIVNSLGQIVGSFRPEVIEKMYKLPLA